MSLMRDGAIPTLSPAEEDQIKQEALGVVVRMLLDRILATEEALRLVGDVMRGQEEINHALLTAVKVLASRDVEVAGIVGDMLGGMRDAMRRDR